MHYRLTLCKDAAIVNHKPQDDIDIEKVVRQNLHCHNLYTYEELDKLKSKNKVQNIFDYI